MSDADLRLTGRATRRLGKLRPGLTCPFCHSEDTFIHQKRAEPLGYAISLFDHDQGDLQSAYRMDLLSCTTCGYTMMFVPQILERYLEARESEHESGEDSGEDDDADRS